MRKGILIAIIIIFILLIGAILGYYFFYLDKNGEPTGETPPGNDFPNLPPAEPENQGGSETPSGGGVETPTVSLPKLRELSDEPVSGAVIIAQKDKAPLVRYVERATGHIYDATTDTSSINRISNTTIPKIYEAQFAEGGTAVILRYLKDDNSIESYYAKLVPINQNETTGESSIALQGVFLPRDIPNLSTSPSGSKIFYLFKTSDGILGTVANPDGSKKDQVWSSPLREWLAEFVDENTVTLQAKPSSSAFGVVYLLNTASGAISQVLGDKIGLTALISPDKKNALYAEASGGIIKTGIRNLASGSTQPFPFNTLPEKCVWSVKSPNTIFCAIPKNLPIGAYPDNWYQGLTAFDDEIWSTDIKTGVTTLVLGNSEKKGVAMDISEPKIASDDSYLIFTNKDDLSLWLLRLNQNQ